MKPLSILLGAVTGATVATLGVGSTADAANFSFQGSFTHDDDVKLIDLSVGATSTVTFQTYSYAGGTQTDGTHIAPGGFDPVLTLFDGNGYFLLEADDDPFGIVAQDPVSERAYDSFMHVVLGAGNYTLALSQFGNFIKGPSLSDGFSRVGNEDFTNDFFGCHGGQFCDFHGHSRTNKWAFDILGIEPAASTSRETEADTARETEADTYTPITPNAYQPTEPDSTSVPEPATATAMVLGLGVLLSRRRQSS